MVAMASSHDLHVIPHGSSIYSYHLQYAFPNCPLAEYINLSPKVSTCDVNKERKNNFEEMSHVALSARYIPINTFIWGNNRRLYEELS